MTDVLPPPPETKAGTIPTPPLVDKPLAIIGAKWQEVMIMITVALLVGIDGVVCYMVHLVIDIAVSLDKHRMETYNLHRELREAVKMFKQEDEQKNSATA
jgi:hypothetical protein